MAQISTDYTSGITSANETTSRNAMDSLDKNAFLQLLVTEMSNQDPLNPMEDSDFIAQLAQFSVLEQMENMNTSTLKSQGMELIGKTVTAVLDSMNSSYVTGRVENIIYNGSSVYANIEGNIVNIDKIKEIIENDAASDKDKDEADKENA